MVGRSPAVALGKRNASAHRSRASGSNLTREAYSAVMTHSLTPSSDRTIGLALSGGGARCFAQVGAITALEDAGFRTAAIAANSSAAILGAISATEPDGRRLEEIVRGIDFSSFLDLDGSTGLIGHEGVKALLSENAALTFEELVIPLAVP